MELRCRAQKVNELLQASALEVERRIIIFIIDSVKLNRASTERQVLAHTVSINGRQYIFTLDTGATQSIIRQDVVKGKCESLSNVRLHTAIGESATDGIQN